MIYLVTKNQELFESDVYKIISVEESLKIMSNWDKVQFDTETEGRDPHICKLLCMQFGYKKDNIQIVVDCSSINPVLYKTILESKLVIGQNLKFDLQFLYNYSIIPLNVYDTMIVEQLLYLGYPSAGLPGGISYSLKAIAERRLGIDIDKTIRGEIIWRGLDSQVIKYAAGDVEYLEDIAHLQIEECKKANCLEGAKLECNFVPAIAYMEWCGIKLDQEKWLIKMRNDKKCLTEAEKALNDFVISTPSLSEFTFINLQGDLFSGFDTTPKVNINWSSSLQVIKIAKILGFNTSVKDKKTGESKDSVLEKALSVQKGINDEFLNLYFKYQEYAKVVSSFGQGHLDAVNPITGRIHTIYKQIGASSGRMSCGSTQPNTDLAKYKKLPSNRCKYPNIQQLPADEPTRSAFVPEKGNNMVSCDFSALESRLGADIYQEHSMLNEFLNGSGDMHSLCAKMVFAEELKDVEIKDIKRVRPDLRKKVKSVEFAKQFGGSAFAISGSLGCSMEEAQKFSDYYDQGFKGVTAFKEKGSRFVRAYGYIIINPITGHRIYWWDWKKWKEVEQKYKSPSWNWDNYKQCHKGTGDMVEQEVREHFKAASKWDRLALNSPTQGTGAIIIKSAATNLFKWIITNNLFNKVKLCALIHDEAVCEFPKELSDFPKILETIMEQSAAKYCKSLPIPAEAEVGDHWIH